MFATNIGETKAQELINPNNVLNPKQISTVDMSGPGNVIYSAQDLDMDKFTSLVMAKVATQSSNNTNNTSSALPAAENGIGF